VTIHRRSATLDAISLGQHCSGESGGKVDTWSGDGIKVQNAGTVAHDLVIESGYVRCYDRTQNTTRMDRRWAATESRSETCSCHAAAGVNANLFIARGGMEASTPTGIIFEDGRLGPDAAHTILLADAVRSRPQNSHLRPLVRLHGPVERGRPGRRAKRPAPSE
jgi:hypothetical protein